MEIDNISMWSYIRAISVCCVYEGTEFDLGNIGWTVCWRPSDMSQPPSPADPAREAEERRAWDALRAKFEAASREDLERDAKKIRDAVNDFRHATRGAEWIERQATDPGMNFDLPDGWGVEELITAFSAAVRDLAWPLTAILRVLRWNVDIQDAAMDQVRANALVEGKRVDLP